MGLRIGLTLTLKWKLTLEGVLDFFFLNARCVSFVAPIGMARNIPRETHCGCGFKLLVGAGVLSIL